MTTDLQNVKEEQLAADEQRAPRAGRLTCYAVDLLTSWRRSVARLQVYSELGIGTAFKIYLPRINLAVRRSRSPRSTRERFT
jgi:hypothetical protein